MSSAHNCRECGKRIRWILNKYGNWIQFEPADDVTGNHIVEKHTDAKTGSMNDIAVPIHPDKAEQARQQGYTTWRIHDQSKCRPYPRKLPAAALRLCEQLGIDTERYTA